MSIFNYFKPKQIVPSENFEIAHLLGPYIIINDGHYVELYN